MTAAIAFLLMASIATGSSVTSDAEALRPAALAFRDRGPAVAELNAALAEAGFHPDGGELFGKRTRHAVYAFQKHHELAVTGVFTPFMWDLFRDPIELPRRPESNRVEVDIGKQVLYVVEDDAVVLVLPVSSGNGDAYIGSNGRRQLATTPEGKFKFQRRIRGWRRAPLGLLWNPYYFRGGIAVHGSPSVPNFPASHGCVRVTMWDMDVLTEHIAVGQTIYVYGVRKEPPPAYEAPVRSFI